MSDAGHADVAALLLGETLLVPHLLPIVDALARLRPELRIDIWVGDMAVERLVNERACRSGGSVHVRRAPDFGRAGKLARLVRLLPVLGRTRAVLCAEQTSLWLPALLPLRTRFVKTAHGAGSMSARGPRRRAAWRLLVPGEAERAAYLARGYPPEKLVATGYIKASFPSPSALEPLFAERRPILLYAPHWQAHRSSWWDWGREIVGMLTRQSDFNVILAPHQRLAERDPGMRKALLAVAGLPFVHVVLEGDALIDGSLLRAADLYLGDTSSQVVEFMARPRPCVFLNPHGLDWRAAGDHGFWEAGEVVDRLAELPVALARAAAEHPRYAGFQRSFAADALGDTGPEAPVRAARVLIEALDA